VLFEKNIIKVQVEQVAKSCKIENGLPEFGFDNFPAIRAELSLQMAFEVVLEIEERGIRRDLLFLGFDADAATACDRFYCSPVHS
jgi:hypothetical protein